MRKRKEERIRKETLDAVEHAIKDSPSHVVLSAGTSLNKEETLQLLYSYTIELMEARGYEMAQAGNSMILTDAIGIGASIRELHFKKREEERKDGSEKTED